MRIAFLAVVAVLTLCSLPGMASAQSNPSFDCNRATSPQEKLICSDEKLAAVDRTLSQAYRALLSNNRHLRREIVASQRQWLQERDDIPCLSLEEQTQQIGCIESSYALRTQELQSKELLVCSQPDRGETRFSITCHAPNYGPRRTFTLSGRLGERDLMAGLERLAFIENGKAVQEVAVAGNIWSGSLEHALRLMDIDFDGYPDLQLWNATSAGPNMGYRYFLYRPETKRFAAADIEDQLSGFEVFPDPESKTIAVTGRVSCCQWANTRYQWVGDALRLMSVLNDGAGLYWDLPLFDDKTPPDCAARTRHYNDAEQLTHIAIAPGGICEPDDDASIIAFLHALQKNPQGYRLDISDETHFSIIYDQPQAPRN
ncbi:lysozyme inhibitor LprI family protein [Alterisphingorhabdus coralli]|uniref:Lysozyme inhibitor LprI family protein n=1 Tax=Alterisphingorhabdus coralli TaxID=3071408 RepID=A0AA97F8A7_9SPHN|nr:lysozyme inhibitor LprI family protein [Parasphingorhabdus sp. SCSIO 66989]WOE76274.1 lysozyme inhibitor LprI family protein [Parasphingorhabdus sp. SCSIO 66989]